MKAASFRRADRLAIRRATASTLFENLELRRLLSAAASYDLTATLYQQPAREDHAVFGASLATSGNLALIGSPGLDGINDKGSARLIDTSSGQTLHVFNDPDNHAHDQFGFGVAFVGNKIAISATETWSNGTSSKVFLYDASTYAPAGVCNAPTGYTFNSSLAALGSDLLADLQPVAGGKNEIARYTPAGGAATAIYSNSGTTGDDFFGFAMTVQGSTVYAYAQQDGVSSVYKLDPTTGNTTTFATSATPGFAAAMTATATALYVCSPVDQAVYEYGTAGNITNEYDAPVADPAYGGAFAGGVAVSGGALIVSGQGASQVFVMDLGNAQLVQLINDPSATGGDGNSDAFGTCVAPLSGGGFIATDQFQDDAALVTDPVDMGAAYAFRPHNDPPTASIAPVAPVDENATATLDGSGSSDPDGNADIVSYAWDLNNDGFYDDATGITTNFTNDLPGTYTVGLKVTDSVGHTSTASTSVTFNNVLPTANAGGNQTGTEGTGVTLHGSGNNAAGDAIVAYEWDLNNDGTFETSGQNPTFNPDLPGSYLVTLRVTDDDGDTATNSATITITDVAPTANAGGNQTANEGTGVSLSGSGTTAPGDSITTYAWDLDNNGSFETSGQNPSFNPDLPGVYTVNLQVTDDDGQTATDSAVITINDVAPTANAGGNQSGTTGAAVNFNGSGTTAPGDSISTYEWDFNYNGATFNASASGASTSHTYAAAGTYTVALRVTDDDGQTAINTASVTITNPPPTNTAPSNASIAAQSSAVRNQTITFTGSYTDPDAGDTHTIAWNFGDGNTSSGTALSVSHAYANSGAFTVTMTVTDSANASTQATLLVNVSASGIQGGALFVGGSSGADNIVLGKNSSGATVVTLNGVNLAPFAGGHVVIYGGTGDDVIDASKTVNAALEIYGQAGNDVILGGGIGDILVGGDGNDNISGNKGRDLIIGGNGADSLFGDQDNDILIAGYTTHDDDSAALNAILNTWNSNQTYDALVASLRSTSLRPGTDVFDDGVVDQLKGGAGTDWFVVNTDVGAKDMILDLKGGEVTTDV